MLYGIEILDRTISIKLEIKGKILAHFDSSWQSKSFELEKLINQKRYLIANCFALEMKNNWALFELPNEKSTSVFGSRSLVPKVKSSSSFSYLSLANASSKLLVKPSDL